MITTRIVSAFVLLLVFAAMSCAPGEQGELSFTQSRPTDEALTGTWTPTEETRTNMVTAAGYAEAVNEITLRADGSFSVTNMPQAWLDKTGAPHVQYASGGGTWRVQQVKDERTIYVIELSFPDQIKPIYLTGQKPPYFIHIDLGAPHSGQYVLFKKTS